MMAKIAITIVLIIALMIIIVTNDIFYRHYPRSLAWLYFVNVIKEIGEWRTKDYY